MLNTKTNSDKTNRERFIFPKYNTHTPPERELIDRFGHPRKDLGSVLIERESGAQNRDKEEPGWAGHGTECWEHRLMCPHHCRTFGRPILPSCSLPSFPLFSEPPTLLSLFLIPHLRACFSLLFFLSLLVHYNNKLS